MPERPGPGLEVENQVEETEGTQNVPEKESDTGEIRGIEEVTQVEESQEPKPPTLSQEVAYIIKESDEIFAALTSTPKIHYDSKEVGQIFTEQRNELMGLDETSATEEATHSWELWQQTKERLEELRPEFVALKEQLSEIQTDNAVNATVEINRIAQKLSEVAREYDDGLRKLETFENRHYAASQQAVWNRDNAEMIKLGLPPLKPGETFDGRRREVSDKYFERDKRPGSERAKDLIPFTKAWSEARKAKAEYHKLSSISSIKFKKGDYNSNPPNRDSYALVQDNGRISSELVAEVYGRLLSLAHDHYQVVWQKAMFDKEEINAVEKAVTQGRLGQLLDWNDNTVRPVFEELRGKYTEYHGWSGSDVIPHKVLHYYRDGSEREEIDRKLDYGKRVLLSDNQYYTDMIEESIATGKVTKDEVVELQRSAILGQLKDNYSGLYSLSSDLERFDKVKTKSTDPEFQAQCVSLEQDAIIRTLESSLHINNIEIINALRDRFPEDKAFQEQYSRVEKQGLLNFIDSHYSLILTHQEAYENFKARYPDPEFQAQLAQKEKAVALKYIEDNFSSLLNDPLFYDNLRARLPDREFQDQCDEQIKGRILDFLEKDFSTFIEKTDSINGLKEKISDPEFQSRCLELERQAVIGYLKAGGFLLLSNPKEFDAIKARYPDEEFQNLCTDSEKNVIISTLSAGSRYLFTEFDRVEQLKARYSDPKFQERCDELEKAGLVGFLLGDENALKNDKLRQHYLGRHSEPAIQLVLKLPDRCPLLFDKRNAQVLRTVKEDFQLFITDERDVDFINNILGQYGNAGQEIISGYGECLKKEIISRNDRENVTEFLKHFRIIGPELLRGYLQARKEHAEEIYFAELQDFLELTLGDKPMDQTQREKPYYRELLHHVFQNNAPNYGDFETTITNCQDRPEDLDEFKREEKYVINALDAGSVRYKERVDAKAIEDEAGVLSEELRAIAAENPTELNEALNTQIEQLLASLPREILPTTQLESNENKLAVLFAVQASGEGEIDPTSLEEIIWRYSLLTFGDHQNVIAGIESRCAQSPNPTYSLLTEYHALAFDNRKEALRNVFQATASDPKLENYFKERFIARQEKAEQSGQKDVVNRMQGKFGISPAFIQQIGERLYGKEQLGQFRAENGEEAVNAHITKLIERYERATGRFAGEKSDSEKSRTKQIYGMLRSRRQATERVLSEFVDAESAESIPLTRVDNELLLSLAYEEAEEKGEYNPESYFSYLSQQSVRIGNTRLSRTEAALDQFESDSGTQAKKLIGCFSKTKESALARMVGGVCVAKDNPQPGVEKGNIWEMPNYIQLVLHDPETMRCQGLVLLHHFTEPDGKKILTASFNPSQGYLQVTDEASIFRGLSQVVMEFAKNNDFDMVGVSTNGTIRTNRTGGLFEKAMDERIDKLERKKYDFSQMKQFSFNPSYQLDSINPIWKNDQETATPEKT